MESRQECDRYYGHWLSLVNVFIAGIGCASWGTSSSLYAYFTLVLV